jgi:pseudouridine-5'-phosphate glycosidase
VNDAFVVADEVREALDAGTPVVGLETSVVGQGLPSPENVECVERMGAAVRARGGVPAWTGVVDGRVRVGLAASELERLVEPGRAMKVARRDVPMAVASGALGATTVSAAVWSAHRAGIRACATGGIGGVHPGDEAIDVSADLLELARTPVLVVCSGPKSIVDPVATAEKLEELGVALVGYRCDLLPFFLARETTITLDHRVDTVEEAAAIARALHALDVRASIMLCNPVPAAHAMDADEVAAAVRSCIELAEREGITGKAVTPFLLSCLAQRTDGRSLRANLALLESNAALAAEVAAALAAP